jgi:membrane protein implicated in regulation of membrane protease activity
MEFFLSAYLIWFIIGLLFIILEMSIPGFVLIFFGAGSWLTAICTYFFDLQIETQILIFLVASVISVLFLRKIFMKTMIGKTDDNISDGLDDNATGHIATVTKDIKPDSPGEIKYRGSFWSTSSDTDTATGTKVRIVKELHSDGIAYKVDPLKK